MDYPVTVSGPVPGRQHFCVLQRPLQQPRGHVSWQSHGSRQEEDLWTECWSTAKEPSYRITPLHPSPIYPLLPKILSHHAWIQDCDYLGFKDVAFWECLFGLAFYLIIHFKSYLCCFRKSARLFVMVRSIDNYCLSLGTKYRVWWNTCSSIVTSDTCPVCFVLMRWMSSWKNECGLCDYEYFRYLQINNGHEASVHLHLVI